MRHILYEASTDWVWNIHEHNRNGTSGLLQRRNCHTADAHDDVWRQRDQFCRIASQVVEIAPNVATFDLEIVANRPTQPLKRLRKGFASRFCLRIVRPKDFENANDAGAFGRLRLRCNWPGRRTAKNPQKLTPPHILLPSQKAPLRSIGVSTLSRSS